MSRRNDTNFIIGDGGSSVVVIKSVAYSHSTIPPVETATVVCTATVYIDPSGGGFKKDDQGFLIEKTPVIYMSDSVTVDVGNRIYSGSSLHYYEVLAVRQHEGHKECDAKQMRGR